MLQTFLPFKAEEHSILKGPISFLTLLLHIYIYNWLRTAFWKDYFVPIEFFFTNCGQSYFTVNGKLYFPVVSHFDPYHKVLISIYFLIMSHLGIQFSANIYGTIFCKTCPQMLFLCVFLYEWKRRKKKKSEP